MLLSNFDRETLGLNQNILTANNFVIIHEVHTGKYVQIHNVDMMAVHLPSIQPMACLQEELATRERCSPRSHLLCHFPPLSFTVFHTSILTLSPSHSLTLSPSHPLTFSPSHPFTLSPSHSLTLSPSHPLTLSPLSPYPLACPSLVHHCPYMSPYTV